MQQRDIADAIRAQNGLSTQYAPGDMEAAILALTWDVGLKSRAVLSSTGVLEFNYVDRRRMVSGGVPVDAWEVSTTGYSSAGSRPWDAVKLQVKKVVIDSSFAQLGITNCTYWFSGFAGLVEVSGFENLSGITNAQQLFSSCGSLETIYATSYTNAIMSGSSMFYGCSRLVGGTDGFVPTNTSAGSVCKLGTGGVLTDPNADVRAWCKVFVYDNGYVEFTAAGTTDPLKTLLASGRLCVNAKYKAAGIIPGYDYGTQFRTVVLRSDMGSFSEINMNYWFYSLTAITSFVGIGNLANVHEMQFAFSACQGVNELDFSGFDPSTLTNLYYCFGGCTALTTIYTDSTWALPSSGTSRGGSASTTARTWSEATGRLIRALRRGTRTSGLTLRGRRGI